MDNNTEPICLDLRTAEEIEQQLEVKDDTPLAKEEEEAEPVVDPVATEDDATEPDESVVQGQPIVITILGNSFACKQVDIKKMVTAKGFVYSQTLTKVTTYLVSSDMPPPESAQKVVQARKYGIPIKGPSFLAELLSVDAI